MTPPGWSVRDALGHVLWGTLFCQNGLKQEFALQKIEKIEQKQGINCKNRILALDI